MTNYQTTKTRSLNIAFVLEPNSLRGLAGVLRESGGQLDYTVKFSDGSSVMYPDIEEVIEQPNINKNSIVSLIAGTPAEDFESAYIVLRNSPEPTVEYTINGPQQQVVYLAYKLDQWVESIRERYSFIYQSGYAVLALVVGFLGPMFLRDRIVARFFPSLPKNSTPWPWQKSVWIAGVWVLEGFCTKLFPKATFAIGQGSKRHEALKCIRIAVFYTVPSAIILGLIASWIYDHYR